MDKIIYLISLFANFLADSKRWIGNLLQNDGRDVYLDYKKRKESIYPYHFKSGVELFIVTSLVRGISFNDGFIVLMDSIQESYVYLFKGKLVTRPRSCWITFLTLLKIGIKKLPKKWYDPEISLKVTRVKPFINFNATECKLIMKEVFVNG